MSYQYIIDNAFKGKFILVIAPYSRKYDVSECKYISANNCTVKEINSWIGYKAIQFEEINDDDKYVFVLESNQELSDNLISYLQEDTTLLQRGSENNYIFLFYDFKIKRMKKCLLPFI